MDSEPTQAAAGTTTAAATAGSGPGLGAQIGMAPGASAAAAGERLHDDLTFAFTVGALYHRARLGWYSGLHRLTMFFNIMLSSAAVAAIKDQPGLAIAINLVVTFATALNLTLDLGARAREHQAARQLYHDLAADLELCAKEEAECRRLRARMIVAAGKEPPVFEAALHDAHNQAILSLGRDQKQMIVMSRCQQLLRHVWPYRGTKFRTAAELART